jgi:branched-chain amino acid transport system substrate-binding protein
MNTKIALCAVLLAGGLLSACASPTPTAAPASATPAPTRAPTDTPRPTATHTASPTPTITLTPSVTPTLSENTLTIEEGEPIRIGYLLAEALELGADSKRGIEVAIDDAGGELLGHPLELIGFDSECNSLAAGRGARRLLVEANLLGVIGTSCSRAAVGAATELSPAGVAMISPSNSDPDLTAVDSHPTTYLRTYPSDLTQARTVAQFAYSALGATRMATLSYFSERYSMHEKDAACQAFADLGGECVAERQIQRGDADLTAVLNKIGQAEPDVLFAILTSPEASLVIQEFREIPGLEDVTLVVQELSFEPRLLELAGEPAVGVYLSRTAADFDRSTDAYQTFLLGYSDRFGGQPTQAFHAFAYDATALLLEAIRKAAIPQPDGSLLVDRQAILAHLYATQDFAGLTGSLSCSPEGDCASAALGGLVYRIDSADPTTWNPGAGMSANPIQVWPAP